MGDVMQGIWHLQDEGNKAYLPTIWRTLAELVKCARKRSEK